MDSDERFALEYLRQQPAAAAGELQRLPASEGAALLSQVPAVVAAPVLAAMVSARAGACVEVLDADSAAAMLMHVPVGAAAALLRCVTEPRVVAVLEALPGWRQSAISLLIRYPVTVIGAWMNPLAPVLRIDDSAGDARDQLRQFDGAVGPRLFLLDPQRHVAGAIDTAELLQRRHRGPLIQLADRGVQPLPARLLVNDVRDHPCWREQLAMPVINRHGEFVGTLDQTALARADATIDVARPDSGGELLPTLLDGGIGVVRLSLEWFEHRSTSSTGEPS